jgi:hypothetical protein
MSETRRTRIFAIGAFGGALAATCTAIICLFVGGYSDGARRALVACWILVAMSLGACAPLCLHNARAHRWQQCVAAPCTVYDGPSTLTCARVGHGRRVLTGVHTRRRTFRRAQLMAANTVCACAHISRASTTHTHIAVELALSASADNLDNLSLEAGILEMHIIGEGGKTLS